jgi:BCD family chlorophyll transporter-like MFS transporter
MGVWGVAHESGEALGGLLGGSVVDLVRLLSGGNAWLAYSTVFTLEAGMLLVALVLVGRVRAVPLQRAPDDAAPVASRA